MKSAHALLTVIVALACWPSAAAERTPAPEGAQVYILWPRDGQVIPGGNLWVRMGLRGAGVCPAGVARSGTGHHHLLLDTDLPPLDEPIPSDRNHLHYGGGETEARLEGLSPGKHTLQLLLGDQNHTPHEPPLYSKKITISVP
ncbi:MAG: DUF4399 domain-containing protein [Gammaproteobacteria bacterium]|jgi:hypothetical protein